MHSAKPRIAIVGGGVGGITAAVLLQQAGYECRVYEQAPRFRRVGAGINLAPNSTRVFGAMGVLAKLLDVGVQPRMKFNREWDSGRVLQTIATQELTRLYGAPFVGVHRGDLHDVLASAVAPGTFHLGKRFVGLEARGSQVRLAFEDGT
ncbi:MAG TPA: FAD-dependent monooxygenase, partial [Casimicrobiaceae bacterium]|nr:FAD-dependent monooxygenase [Casimicrobiaceae bacterium]